MNELVTTGELAVKLNLPKHKLYYMLERGYLPDATTRVGGRRLFTVSEVERVQVALEIRERTRAALKQVEVGHGKQ